MLRDGSTNVDQGTEELTTEADDVSKAWSQSYDHSPALKKITTP
jgi:hypothetical protein